MKTQGNPTGRLRAGAAAVDITPRMGTQIAGDIGRRRPAEILLDPIFAKALVLDDGSERLCVLCLDVLGIGTEWTARIRRGVAERYGLPPEAVMVHATQNHAAPAVGHFFFNYEWECIPAEHRWIAGGDDAYHEFAVARAVEAVGRALDRMEPVRVGWATGLEHRVASNRRLVMRDGTAEMGMWSRPQSDVAHVEGPIDPEVAVVSFTTEQLRPVALLLHFTSHPCHGYPERFITADWPGAWARSMQEPYGPDCTAFVLNGCCGNVIHGNSLDPAQPDSIEHMGACLTETARGALRQLRYADDSRLGKAGRMVRIPFRPLTDAQIEEARQILDAHPGPQWKKGQEGTAVEWDWIYALSCRDLQRLYREKAAFDYEIQTFRIGALALVALMGEPFVEGQLDLKIRSPAARTLVAHMSNGYVGYIPTAGALRRGGYETRVGNWSKLAGEALDTIVNESVNLLEGLFAGDGR